MIHRVILVAKMKLKEYVNGIRPDSRGGSGYGNTQKDLSGYGSPYTKNSYFPYGDPVEEVEDQDAIHNSATAKKFNAKLNRNYVSNNPAARSTADRGAYVNGSTRLDLYETKFSLKNIDELLLLHESTGGISQLYAMGNGAGIFKVHTGKTIGMNIGSSHNALAVKTKKRIYSLKDVLLGSLNDEEENEELQRQKEIQQQA